MEYLTKRGQGGLNGRVTHSGQAGPIRDAEVRLFRVETKAGRKDKDKDKIYLPESAIAKAKTDSAGAFRFDVDLEDGAYLIRSKAFGISADAEVEVTNGVASSVPLDIDLGLRASTHAYGEGDRLMPALRGMVGRRL